MALVNRALRVRAHSSSGDCGAIAVGRTACAVSVCPRVAELPTSVALIIMRVWAASGMQRSRSPVGEHSPVGEQAPSERQSAAAVIPHLLICAG